MVRFFSHCVVQVLLAAVLSAAVIAPVLAQNTPTQTTSANISLAWNTEGVSIQDGRLSLTNNLGYRIELDQAYIVDLSVELVPCREWSGSLGAEIHAALFGRPAHAGHSLFGSPSKLQNSVAESLTGGGPMALGTLTAPDIEYCKAHYLIGRAWAVTKALPETPKLLNLSLYLKGRYQAPGGGVAQGFEIKTAEASGRLIALKNATGDAVNGKLPKAAQIQVMRGLGTLFDDIKFSNPSSAQTARAVLRNLVSATTATVIVQ